MDEISKAALTDGGNLPPVDVAHRVEAIVEVRDVLEALEPERYRGEPEEGPGGQHQRQIHGRHHLASQVRGGDPRAHAEPYNQTIFT